MLGWTPLLQGSLADVPDDVPLLADPASAPLFLCCEVTFSLPSSSSSSSLLLPSSSSSQSAWLTAAFFLLLAFFFLLVSLVMPSSRSLNHLYQVHTPSPI